MTFPSTRGLQAAPMVDGSFVLNRLVWEESLEFRIQWRMLVVPLPLVLQYPGGTPRPVRRPPVAHQLPIDTISIRALINLRLDTADILQHPTFLVEVRKVGLGMLLAKVRTFNTLTDIFVNPDHLHKIELVQLIIREFPSNYVPSSVQADFPSLDPRKPILKIIGSQNFLNTCAAPALDVILHNLGVATNGGNVYKINMILRKVPLDIYVYDDDGVFVLELNRHMTLEQIHSMALMRRYKLENANSEFSIPSTLVDGAVLTLTPVVPPRTTIAVSDNAVQIFVTFGGVHSTLLVDLDMTVATLLKVLMNKPDVRVKLLAIEGFVVYQISWKVVWFD